MYWILAIMAAIAATLIALVVGGLVTPAEYRVVRRIRLPRGAPELRALLGDLAAYEQWAPSPTTLERQPSTRTDVIALRVTDDDTKWTRQWEWQIDADDTDSVLTLTESGRVGNPVIRFFAALQGHGGNAERTLRALAEHCNEFGVAITRVGR